MRKLLCWLVLIVAVVCAGLSPVLIPLVGAQNIEGQPVAAQFGAWKVPGTAPDTYSFVISACTQQAGRQTFHIFQTNAPLRIVDANPAMSETVTPSQYYANGQQCSIVIAPVNEHNSFYITSGTGGLQEALNANLGNPAANTVILSNQWYVQGGSTAIIGQVKGSTSIGLIDVTTTPYTSYIWNGTQYVATAGPGGGFTPNTDLGGTAIQTNVIGINGQNLSALGAGIYKFNSAGVPSKATAGTDYVIPSGSVANAALAGNVTGIVQLANGGTGTATPGLIGGANVTVTGAWPNQTISSTGGGGSFTPNTDLSGTSTLTHVVGINGTNLSSLGAGVLQQDGSGNPSIANTAPLLGTDTGIPSAAGPFGLYQIPCVDSNLGLTTTGCPFYYAPGTNLQAAYNYLATNYPGSTLRLNGTYPVATPANPAAGLQLASTAMCVNLEGEGLAGTSIKTSTTTYTITNASPSGTAMTLTVSTPPTDIINALAAGWKVYVSIGPGTTLFPTLSQTTAQVSSATSSTITFASTLTGSAGTETGTVSMALSGGGVSNAFEPPVNNIAQSGGTGTPVTATLGITPTSLNMVVGSSFEFAQMANNTGLNFVKGTVASISGNTVTVTVGSGVTANAPGADTGFGYVLDKPFGCKIKGITFDTNFQALAGVYVGVGQNWDIEDTQVTRVSYGNGFNTVGYHLSDYLGSGAKFYEATLINMNCIAVTADYTALSVPVYCKNFDTSASDNTEIGGTSRSYVFGYRMIGGQNYIYKPHVWGTFGPFGVASISGRETFIGAEADGIQGTSAKGASPGAAFTFNAGSDGSSVSGTKNVTSSNCSTAGTCGAVFAIVAPGVKNLQIYGNDFSALVPNNITSAVLYNGGVSGRDPSNLEFGNANDFGETNFGNPYTIASTGTGTSTANLDFQYGLNQTLTLVGNTALTLANVKLTGLPGMLFTVCQPAQTPATSFSITGNVVTMVTNTQVTPYVAGQSITIAGSSAYPYLNGTFTLTSATPTSITFPLTNANVASTALSGVTVNIGPFTISYTGYIQGAVGPPMTGGACVVQHMTTEILDGVNISVLAMNAGSLNNVNTRLNGRGQTNYWASDDVSGAELCFFNNCTGGFGNNFYAGNINAPHLFSINHNGDYAGNNASSAGSFIVTAAGTPAAPAVVPTGGASGSYTYSVQAVDKQGNVSAIGAAANITNGPTTLSGSTYNTIFAPVTPGAESFNFCNGSGQLIGNVSALLAVQNTMQAQTLISTGLQDIGQTPTGACPTTATSGASFASAFTLRSTTGLHTITINNATAFPTNVTQTDPDVAGTLGVTVENLVSACTGSVGLSNSASLNTCVLTGNVTAGLSAPSVPSAQNNTISFCQTTGNSFTVTLPSSISGIGGTVITPAAGTCSNYDLEYSANTPSYIVTGTNTSAAGGGTITGVTAGTGLTGGGTSGTVTVALATALPNGETATTQTAGDNTLKVATDAFVAAAVAAGTAGVSSFNTRTGAVTPASGDYTVSQVTGAAPLASPTFTGTVTIPTLSLTNALTVANGGTGTASPGLVAGTGIGISGTWPNQTISATGSTPSSYVTFTGPASDQTLTAAYTSGGTTMTVASTTGYTTPSPTGYIAVGYSNGAFDACSYTGLTSTQFTGLTCGLFGIADGNQAIGQTVQEIKSFSANATNSAADVISLWKGNTLHSCSSGFNSFSFQAYSAGAADVFCNSSSKGTTLTGQLSFAGGAGAPALSVNSGATGINDSGNLNIQGAGAASLPGLTVSGAPYTAGTATTNFPQFYVSASGATAPTTLSTSGTMVGINAPSGFAGNLFACYVNGTGECSITAAGLASFNGMNSTGNLNLTSTSYGYKFNSAASIASTGTNIFNFGSNTINSTTGILNATEYVATPGTVTFSATPVFNGQVQIQTLTLTANVTSSTVSNIAAGQQLNIVICENSTGGFTFVGPTTLHGLGTISTTASTCSAQNFVSTNGTDYYATGAMVTGMAP